ncbi:hypothetical protein ABPG74_022563 [Tetrahymena malaccensis]
MKLEQKDPSKLEQNENKIHLLYQIKHFLITQIQTLLLAIFVTAMMQFSNHLAIYLIYCCPMYFFLASIQWFVIWKHKLNFKLWFHIYNGIMLIVCVPIFFGVFFGVFHPTASLEFKQAQNCQMIGQLSNWIEHTEKYSILYINFEYEGKEYLGQACASNLFEAKTAIPILPYKFYKKFDGIACGPSDGNNTDPQQPRLLSQKYFNLTKIRNNQRILRTVGRNHYNSGSGSCYTDYLWSKVKIASWLCQERGFNISQFMNPQSCYVYFFNGDKAIQNGLLRYEMKDQNDFPLVAYKRNAYFPQIDLICLILFSYYNWILSFNSIFNYSTNYFLKMIKYQKDNIQVTPASLEVKPNEQKKVQLEQTNKEMQNLNSNSNSIIQQYINESMSNQSDYIAKDIIPQDQLQKSYSLQLQQNQVPIFTNKRGAFYQSSSNN